ncbi:hypothetical protein FJU95_18320 [Acinetobacter baumannii]|nr:hypothetical protein AbaMCR8683_13800 [Acinetobacter baumannii]RJN65854.1 hypothetical protein D3X67_18645 [Acinetobacter baumannii]TPU82366.1 hypothetical protein FJU95_18320 [Acinetobacter baumannii]HAV5336852.1 hypothetical protein [Acinetobacter baumannii]HAV5550360.1 hypothetical protein [Acinetobacter baumannii]
MLFSTGSLRPPFFYGRTEGDALARAGSLCTSLLTPFVLPPLFSSNRGSSSLIHKEFAIMRTISSLSLATFAKIFDSIPNWSLKRFSRL